jgi:hypothetical protein
MVFYLETAESRATQGHKRREGGRVCWCRQQVRRGRQGRITRGLRTQTRIVLAGWEIGNCCRCCLLGGKRQLSQAILKMLWECMAMAVRRMHGNGSGVPFTAFLWLPLIVCFFAHSQQHSHYHCWDQTYPISDTIYRPDYGSPPNFTLCKDKNNVLFSVDHPYH